MKLFLKWERTDAVQEDVNQGETILAGFYLFFSSVDITLMMTVCFNQGMTYTTPSARGFCAICRLRMQLRGIEKLENEILFLI